MNACEENTVDYCNTPSATLSVNCSLGPGLSLVSSGLGLRNLVLFTTLRAPVTSNCLAART